MRAWGRLALIALIAGHALLLQPCRTNAQTADDLALERRLTELMKSGNTAEAMAVAHSAVDEAERQFGADHQSVAVRLFLLALLHRRNVEAGPLFIRALTIAENAFGPQHMQVGAILDRLADYYWAHKRYAEAEPLYRRVLGIREAISGPEHPEVASVLNKLAEVCRMQGKLAHARPLQERALAIREKALGTDHKDVAISLNNLALVLTAEKHFEQAERMFVRTLPIYERTVGSEHLETGKVLENFGDLYQAQGRAREAEPLFVRALAIREKASGQEHGDVASTLNKLAQVHIVLRQDDEAEPLLKRYLAMREKALGPNHLDLTFILDDLAALNERRKQYADALSLRQRALSLREVALGPDNRDVGASAFNLAATYRKQSRDAEAQTLLQRVVAITDRRGGDESLLASALSALADLSNNKGNYDDAQALEKRALEIRERTLGSEHPDVAQHLGKLAFIYHRWGRDAEGEPLAKRSLTIREKVLGPDHGDVADSLHQLALIHVDQGRYAEVEPLHRRSLAIREKALGAEHPKAADAVNAIGELYMHQGRFADAEPLFVRALAIREKALGPDHLDVATSLNNLAVLHKDRGRYTEAETLYRRVLAIREKALGPDHRHVGIVLNNLASLYAAQARHTEAEAVFKRAIATYERTLGPDHPDIAYALNNLATLYRNTSRLTEAERLYQRVLTILEKSRGPDHDSVGTVLSNLAIVYNDQKRRADAEALYKRALALKEKALGPDNVALISTMQSLAALYQDQGRYAEAGPLYMRALTIGEMALGPDHPTVGNIFGELGVLSFVQQDWGTAAGYLRRYADLIVRRTQRGAETVGSAVTAKTRSEVEQWTGVFLLFIKALYRSRPDRKVPYLGDEPLVAAQWALASEAAASLAQMAARQAKADGALARLIRERQDLVGEWQSKDKILFGARFKETSKPNPDIEAALRERVATIDTRIGDIDKTLARDFPDYAALANPAPLSMEEVQAQLRPDEALVLPLVNIASEPTPEETFVWVITKTQSRSARTEFGSKGIAELVQALRCGLDSRLWVDASDWPETTSQQMRQKEGQIARRERCLALLKAEPVTERVGMAPVQVLPFDLARAHALYQALLGPAEDMIKGKRLIIVPSGALTSLPFNVLVTRAPQVAIPKKLADYRQVAWLGARQPITVLPSVASLKALRQFAKTSQATKPYLGIGNPLLEGPQDDMRWGVYYRNQAELARTKHCATTPASQQVASARGPRSMRDFASVFRGAQADVEHVRSLTPLPETADEICEVGRRLRVPESEILLGAQATEGRMKVLSEQGRLADYAIVHFATHGTLTGDVRGSAEPGLILTPPEKGTSDAVLERDDGFLSASEIATLKLDADWVILSACNTAGAQSENAEALSGMARAFFYAGARTLLVSHWEVGSDAAVKLTTRAFAEMAAKRGIGRAEAMRISMRALIADGTLADAHPSTWAPFVVVGEGSGQEHGATHAGASPNAPVLSKAAVTTKKKKGEAAISDWRTDFWWHKARD
jgi:tetratricopeptide (TPR) repeat protein/CHAT domain-containing protein